MTRTRGAIPGHGVAVGPPAGGVPLSSMKKLLFAMAIGAALAWLLDPEQGAARRAVVRQRAADAGLIDASSTST